MGRRRLWPKEPQRDLYGYYVWSKGYYAELLHFLYLQFYSYESSSYDMFTIMNFKLGYVYNYESFKCQKKIMLIYMMVSNEICMLC